MKTYGQSSKWKQSWGTFPLGMSLWHTGISSDIHAMSLETYMQMYRALHVQRCLRFSQCCTCIFKLICHAHKSVYADTFTYEHSCHSPGCDSGWQVLCHFPRVIGGAESQHDRDEGREMSFIHCHSPMTQPFLWFTHIPGFSSDEVTLELLHCVLMWLIPVVLVLSAVAHLNLLLLVNLY